MEKDMNWKFFCLQYTVVDTIFPSNDGFKELLAVRQFLYIAIYILFLQSFYKLYNINYKKKKY